MAVRWELLRRPKLFYSILRSRFLFSPELHSPPRVHNSLLLVHSMVTLVLLGTAWRRKSQQFTSLHHTQTKQPLTVLVYNIYCTFLRATQHYITCNNYHTSLLPTKRGSKKGTLHTIHCVNQYVVICSLVSLS